MTSAKNVDWAAVDERIRHTIHAKGLRYEDICKCIGIDFHGNIPAQRDALPKMETALSLASILGVPAAWLLFGKDEQNAGTHQSVIDTAGSTIVQGNRARTLIVNSTGEKMDAQRQELNRIFSSLSMRGQTKLLSLAYEVEDAERSA